MPKWFLIKGLSLNFTVSGNLLKRCQCVIMPLEIKAKMNDIPSSCNIIDDCRGTAVDSQLQSRRIALKNPRNCESSFDRCICRTAADWNTVAEGSGKGFVFGSLSMSDAVHPTDYRQVTGLWLDDLSFFENSECMEFLNGIHRQWKKHSMPGVAFSVIFEPKSADEANLSSSIEKLLSIVIK